MVSKLISYVLLVTMAATCLGQEPEEEDMGWYVGAMPDPMTSPGACGRNAPSLLCDPDNLLPLQIANSIDDKLHKIYNETSVPCYTADPSRIKGYLVMLAVVPKMKRYFTKSYKDYNLITRYTEGRSFAYNLGINQLWGKHANCKEMVIILYSKEDNVLITITQERARRQLTDVIVRDINLEMFATFYPFTETDKKAATAIDFVVGKYSNILSGGEK